MLSYRYEGITSTGETVHGVVDASSQEEALDELRASGVFVQRCEPTAETATATGDVGPDFPESQPNASGPDPGSGATVPKRQWTRRQAAVLLSVFTLGGTFFAVLGAWNTWHMTRQLAAARPTAGVIHSTAIRTERSTDSDGRTTTHYVPDIEFRYRVDGTEYVSDRIYPGHMLIRGPAEENRSNAERLIREFAPGKEVTVWHLPDEPGTAFLRRVRPLTNGLFSLVGGILAAAGAGLLLPQLLSDRTTRFLCAVAVFGFAQGLTWLLWEAFLSAPAEELDGSPRLLQWLLAAYVLVCWSALIGNAPAHLQRTKQATFVAVGCGTLSMSLSLFVLLPLMWIAPRLEPLSALPWIGVGMGILSLVLWSLGFIKIGGRGPDRFKAE